MLCERHRNQDESRKKVHWIADSTWFQSIECHFEHSVTNMCILLIASSSIKNTYQLTCNLLNELLTTGMFLENMNILQ